MLEEFRVPVCQHLGGLGYSNVGESSGRQSSAAAALAAGTDQHLDSKGGGAGSPRNLGWRNQYSTVQISQPYVLGSLSTPRVRKAVLANLAGPCDLHITLGVR